MTEAHVTACKTTGRTGIVTRRTHQSSGIRRRKTTPTVAKSQPRGGPQKEARDQWVRRRIARTAKSKTIKTVCCRWNESRSGTDEEETGSRWFDLMGSPLRCYLGLDAHLHSSRLSGGTQRIKVAAWPNSQPPPRRFTGR